MQKLFFFQIHEQTDFIAYQTLGINTSPTFLITFYSLLYLTIMESERVPRC